MEVRERSRALSHDDIFHKSSNLQPIIKTSTTMIELLKNTNYMINYWRGGYYEIFLKEKEGGGNDKQG